MLYLASFVVALSYSSEIRDIKFTEFTQATALERFQTENMCGNQFDLAGFLPMNGWHAALYILAWLRQFVFLPVLITAVPMLVSTNGGDAQTIALSCVSILFFLDVDNYIYEYGLDESTREYLDENARVELDDEKVALTSRIKMSFIVCLPFMIIHTIYMTTASDAEELDIMLKSPMFICILAAFETLLKLPGAPSHLHRVGMVVRWLIFRVFMVFFSFWNLFLSAFRTGESHPERAASAHESDYQGEPLGTFIIPTFLKISAFGILACTAWERMQARNAQGDKSE